jgi:cellulose synthase/poly-beta-1,6-N-acetylglucosamine synthase-like glycosyltransferase
VAFLVLVLIVSLGVGAWVYLGYPLFLVMLARLRPAPRVRAPVVLRVSAIVAAHNEGAVIGEKIRNLRASNYPADALEIVVASDGSTDDTVAAARMAGADVLLDLPRLGKVRTLSEAVAASQGALLVFTDADGFLEPGTLASLVSNFADPRVGGAAGNQVSLVTSDASVAGGEGLYWRYEQWIKLLEDRVGSTVSATGSLYAVRRELFTPPHLIAGADDFLISTEVVRRGHRLVYDDAARVHVDSPAQSATAVRRKVRVINGGLRAAFSLGRLLIPFVGGLYGFEVLTHKILRRFVPLFLIAALASSILLTVADPRWWLLLGPQLALYGLALGGWLGRGRRWGRARAFYVPYFFCLANTASLLAVVSIARGVRFERWEPAR